MTDLNTIGMVDSRDYDAVVKKLRKFFSDKGFIEIHTQSRLSILAACEDVYTIAMYNYAGQVWPLPQTGQMWLEYELLKNPSLPGVFCVSTSFRNEPNPVPGRHDLIFPMFEFELPGGMEVLIEMERELCHYLGFTGDFPRDTYQKICEKYGSESVEHKHEEQLQEDYNSSVFFLTDFPVETSPFWNMAKNADTTAKKVDVIIDGRETIGSAERSTDTESMREQFYTISSGGYAKTLFGQFTKKRVEEELEEFLKFKFFTRSGGGIGLTRLIRGMKNHRLLL